MKRARPVPKFLEAAFGLYPVIQIAEVIAAVTFVWAERSLLASLVLVFVTYLQSPLIYRLVRLVFGTSEGMSKLGKKHSTGNLWIIEHQLQQMYITFLFFEVALRLLPGLYSAWLRLWGAKIGRAVRWTPHVQVVDRPHLNLGSRILFGHETYISSHAIKKYEGIFLVMVKPVQVGDDVVTGYRAVLTAGVRVGDGALVESGGTLYPGYELPKGGRYERYQELFERNGKLARTGPA